MRRYRTITINNKRNQLKLYNKARENGWQTLWVGNGLITMCKFYNKRG